MPRHTPAFLRLATAVLGIFAVTAAARAAQSTGSPVDHLPANIKHVLTFGERADWSLDGKKILFLTKMFGDAMELDLDTGVVTNLTDYYPHYGYTRALYLSNGDILLCGPKEFDPKNAREARRNTYFYVLVRGSRKPPVMFEPRLNEGPAVSRHQLKVAWAAWTDPKPGEGNLAFSKMYAGDIVYANGAPALQNVRMIKDGADMPYRCTLETQNFNPANEDELIFNTYTDGGAKSDFWGMSLSSERMTHYGNRAEIYEEAEGVFPDGKHTLVECDEQNPGGPGNIDLWKFALDGSGTRTRLTHFNDFKGYKASNGVVSDDGTKLAFQMGHSADEPGIGHGIFVMDLTAEP